MNPEVVQDQTQKNTGTPQKKQHKKGNPEDKRLQDNDTLENIHDAEDPLEEQKEAIEDDTNQDGLGIYEEEEEEEEDEEEDKEEEDYEEDDNEEDDEEEGYSKNEEDNDDDEEVEDDNDDDDEEEDENDDDEEQVDNNDDDEEEEDDNDDDEEEEDDNNDDEEDTLLPEVDDNNGDEDYKPRSKSRKPMFRLKLPKNRDEIVQSPRKDDRKLKRIMKAQGLYGGEDVTQLTNLVATSPRMKALLEKNIKKWKPSFPLLVSNKSANLCFTRKVCI